MRGTLVSPEIGGGGDTSELPASQITNTSGSSPELACIFSTTRQNAVNIAHFVLPFKPFRLVVRPVNLLARDQILGQLITDERCLSFVFATRIHALLVFQSDFQLVGLKVLCGSSDAQSDPSQDS